MKAEFDRSLDELKRIVKTTDDFFAAHGVDARLRNKVDLATEELFVNLVTYNTETSERVLIEMQPVNGGVEVSLTDRDVERFDPTRSLKKVDVDAPLDEREPGGLGLYLVMKMVDSIHYEYHDRRSTVSFRVSADEPDV